MPQMTLEQANQILSEEKSRMSRKESMEIAVRDMTLRQWCVEKAVAAIAAASPYTSWAPQDAHDTARLIYEFVTNKQTDVSSVLGYNENKQGGD